MRLRLKFRLRETVLLMVVLLAPYMAAEPAQARSAPPRVPPERMLQRPSLPLPDIRAGGKQPVQDPKLTGKVPAQLPRGKILLRKIIISGATVYKPAELKHLWAGLLNRRVKYAELYGIANRITAKYHADGYLISQAFVPGQKINTANGEVRIWVVEGSLGSYQVSGTPGGSRAMIKRYAEKLLKLRPLRRADLERYLLLMNDLPGTTVVGYISPGSRGLLDARLILNAAVKKFSGLAGVDNRGSKFFGPGQLYATLQGNALFGLGGLLEASPMITFDGDTITSKGGFINLRVPIFAEGAYLQLYFAGSQANPGDYLEPLDLKGEAVIGTLAVGHPFLRSVGRYLYGAVQLDFIESKEDIYGSQPFIEDHLRMLRAHLAYGAADAWGGENFFNIRLSVGLDGLGASRDGDPLRSRTNARSDFVAAKISAMRRQSLNAISSNSRILFGVMGQYSPDPLLSGEELGLGGPVFLRGYDFYDVSGDYGLAARLELQYGLPLKNTRVFSAAEIYCFYDIGKVWNHDPLPYETPDGSLASAGAGFRMTMAQRFFAGVYAAKPLTGDVTASRDRDTRYFFQLGVVW